MTKPKSTRFKKVGQSNYAAALSFDWVPVAIDSAKVSALFPELLFEFGEFARVSRLKLVIQTHASTTQVMLLAALKAIYTLRNFHNQAIYKPHEAEEIINVTELYSTLHSGKVPHDTQTLIEAAISVLRGMRFEGQPLLYREAGSRINLELYRDYCTLGTITPAMHQAFQTAPPRKSGSIRRKKK